MAACLDTNYPQGERLYKHYCTGCHLDDGGGLLALYPPIADSDYLEEAPSRLPCIIKNGLSDSIVVNGVLFNAPMEGIEGITTAEIANICNYIQEQWYPDWKPWSAQAVDDLLSRCNEID